MSKLRLKKRSEKTIIHETSPNIAVDKPPRNDDFKPIQLPSAESRRRLYKLLLGDGPLSYAPLPPSKLLVQTETTEEDSKRNKSIQKEGQSSFNLKEERHKNEWHRLPPPNIKAILSQMPPGPGLSAEELFAPSSDEEEEREEDKERVIEEEEKFSKDVPFPESLTEPTKINNMDHSSNQNSPNLPRQSSKKRKPDKTNLDYQPCKSSTTQSTLSNIISHVKSDNSVVSASSKYPEKGKAPVSRSEDIHQSQVIDLTDPEPTNMQEPSTSKENRSMMTYQPPGSSGYHSTDSHLADDPYEIPNDEEFNTLCYDIDMSTIDNFSDSETETRGAREPQGREESQSQFLNKEKSEAGPSGSDVHRSMSHDFSEPESVCDQEPMGKNHNSSSGKGKNRVGCSSYNHQPMVKYNGVKRRHDVIDGATCGSFKRPRLNCDEEESIMNRNNASSSHTRSTIGHTESKERKSITPKHPQVHRNLNSDCRNGLSSNTDKKQKSIIKHSGNRPRATVGKSTADSQHTMGASSNIDKSLHQTRCDRRDQTRDGNRVTREGRPPVGSRSGNPDSGPQQQTSTDPASFSHSTSGGSSRITPLGSQLTTDICPMCNTKFPSWYEQVDADRHIAQCLQAVLDLERDNDLVLL